MALIRKACFGSTPDFLTLSRKGKTNTDVASRKVADQGLGSRGEDVHAEAKQRLVNAASDLRGLQGASA